MGLSLPWVTFGVTNYPGPGGRMGDVFRVSMANSGEFHRLKPKALTSSTFGWWLLLIAAVLPGWRTRLVQFRRLRLS